RRSGARTCLPDAQSCESGRLAHPLERSLKPRTGIEKLCMALAFGGNHLFLGVGDELLVGELLVDALHFGSDPAELLLESCSLSLKIDQLAKRQAERRARDDELRRTFRHIRREANLANARKTTDRRIVTRQALPRELVSTDGDERSLR